MREVWLLFKFIEAIFGAACIYFHIVGFLLPYEPLPHNLIYCGTFTAFTLFSVFGIASICMGEGSTPLMEAVVNFVGAFMYVMVSIMSMSNAENDFHLMYLSDQEEPTHPFFACCKSQSISALGAGAAHLLHAIFAVDMLIIREDNFRVRYENDVEPQLPIQIYFISKPVQDYLETFHWFRNLTGKRNQNEPNFTV